MSLCTRNIQFSRISEEVSMKVLDNFYKLHQENFICHDNQKPVQNIPVIILYTSVTFKIKLFELRHRLQLICLFRGSSSDDNGMNFRGCLKRGS